MMTWRTITPTELTAKPSSSPLYEKVYVGCMTGTSVDAQADFTAAVFDNTGQLISYRNQGVPLPAALQEILLGISQQAPETMTCWQRHDCEARLTHFLIDTYRSVLADMGLLALPKAQIVLSPHGQTIAHYPNLALPYTDQLIHGEQLAQALGYDVVFRHRQGPLQVSLAAPLAPVLIKNCLTTGTEDTVVINGGGIANITILRAKHPEQVQGWDTGPANGPLDAIIAHVIQHFPAAIPNLLRDDILRHRCDFNGAWATASAINLILREKLLQHEYFSRPVTLKSVDRREFSLPWILQQADLQTLAWGDILATVADVVAVTLANDIIAAFAEDQMTNPVRIIGYGGMMHNHFIQKRLQHYLESVMPVQFVSMESLQLDPDYFESLLMALLGFYADNQRAIDLRYCQLPNIAMPYAVPGVVARASDRSSAIQTKMPLHKDSDFFLQLIRDKRESTLK